MKEILTAVTAAATAVFLWRKKRISKKGMLVTILFAAVGLGYCLLRGFSGEWIPVTSVEKGGQGSSNRQMEFQIQVEDTDSRVTLEIPSLQLEEEEAQSQLSDFIKRLDQEILGENTSLMEVCYPLRLLTSYPDSSIQVQWHTDRPNYLNWEGKLGTDIPEEGVTVQLKGELLLQDCREVYQRQVQVFPSKDTADLPGRIRTQAKNLNQDGSDAEYHLPDSIDKKRIQWYLVSDSKGWLLVCIALFLPGGFALVQQQKKREEEKKREEVLDKEYPDLVSRMQILLGAGLGMRMVFERIAREYKEEEENKKKKRKKSLIYEEIVISCRELENGLSEAEVYRRLGNRCGTPSYRGLALLLEQNMTKGSQGLMLLLEQEALESFESRQRRARQEGEKVSVRLLLPMGMMLMIVLALIMIPAFLSM